MDDTQLQLLKDGKVVEIFEPDSKKRRDIHKWCNANGYSHVSYLDRDKKFNTVHSYYCPTCNEWNVPYYIRACCDECPDYSVICKNCESF